MVVSVPVRRAHHSRKRQNPEQNTGSRGGAPAEAGTREIVEPSERTAGTAPHLRTGKQGVPGVAVGPRFGSYCRNRQILPEHLIPVFGSTLLSDITAEDVARYQRKRQQEKAEGRTVNMEVGVLRGVLTAHRLWERIAPDVHMLPERKDVGRALTPEEERRLLEATRRRGSACHTATVLALNTSMSRKEVRTLTWEQIDFEARTVRVGKSKNEFRTGRLIPLNPAAFEALVQWAGRYPDAEPTHCVFPWQDQGKTDPTRPTNGWRTAWEEARKQAGVNVRFHDLRVTCITKLAEGQASDQTIKAIAGHVSERMLEHYSRIRMDAKRRALDAISQPPETSVFGTGVHQNGNQVEIGEAGPAGKLLN